MLRKSLLSALLLFTVSIDSATAQRMPELRQIFERWTSQNQQVPFGHWSEAEMAGVRPGAALLKGNRNAAAWQQYADEQNEVAQQVSDRLEKFIREWLAGKNDGRIPGSILPKDLDNSKLGNWRLVDPDSVEADSQWWVRKTHDIDSKELYFLFPDNHCTYAKFAFIAPFGSRLNIAGEFPHARFFDLQCSGPYDPLYPATVGFGAGEVPIVDADIDPLPGHTNPFRVGANRNVKQRSYEVTFLMERGNAAEKNPSFKPPAYRGKGNERVGGPFRDAGPGLDGLLHPGIVWMRYYLPDRKHGSMAGVPLPKVWFTLDTGERFWVQPESLDIVDQRQNHTVATRVAPAEHPDKASGQECGWLKGFGIMLTAFEMPVRKGMIDAKPVGRAVGKGIVRSMDAKLFNRGPDQGAPGSYAVTATGCSYIHYLHRGMSIAPGHVAVITGRLPTTPATFDSEEKMTSAQARYWSLTHYDPEHKPYAGVLMGSVCDANMITTDTSERWYCIALSNKEDRPRNATGRNGVTWQDWGPVGQQLLLIRWMTVDGDWEDPAITPNEAVAPWRKCAWSQTGFDSTLLSENRPGLLGDHHPVVHYMPRREFERLGKQPLESLRESPIWKQ